MSYNQNIPQPTDQLKNSQPQILANFAALNPFGNGYADFPLQGATPTFGVGDTGLYTINNANTTQNEMYIHKASNGTFVNVPMTASKMSNNAAAACTSGWSYLPSGLLVKWGYSFVVNTNGFQTVTTGATSGGPDFTQPFTAFITPLILNVANNNFQCFFSAFVGLTGNMQIAAYNTSPNPSNLTRINYLIIGV